MIANILSFLFPVRLPGKMKDWPEPVTSNPLRMHEQGWAGNVRRVYRDGIERHFAEQEKGA